MLIETSKNFRRVWTYNHMPKFLDPLRPKPLVLTHQTLGCLQKDGCLLLWTAMREAFYVDKQTKRMVFVSQPHLHDVQPSL